MFVVLKCYIYLYIFVGRTSQLMITFTAPFFSSPRCMSRGDCISWCSAYGLVTIQVLITCNTGVARPAGVANYRGARAGGAWAAGKPCSGGRRARYTIYCVRGS